MSVLGDQPLQSWRGILSVGVFHGQHPIRPLRRCLEIRLRPVGFFANQSGYPGPRIVPPGTQLLRPQLRQVKGNGLVIGRHIHQGVRSFDIARRLWVKGTLGHVAHKQR